MGPSARHFAHSTSPSRFGGPGASSDQYDSQYLGLRLHGNGSFSIGNAVDCPKGHADPPVPTQEPRRDQQTEIQPHSSKNRAERLVREGTD